MVNENVKYSLKARYTVANICDEKIFETAVDSFAEAIAKTFEECLLELDYDTETLNEYHYGVNIAVIVVTDETYRVPAFPLYFKCLDCFCVFALDEDSCEVEVLK